MACDDFRTRDAAVDAVEAMGAAAAIEGILARLADLLSNRNSSTRRAAANAVRAMGIAAATEGFLARLADLLACNDSSTREAAVSLVKTMGVEAAIKGFLARLADLLACDESSTRRAAVDAVKAMGLAAATKGILKPLTDVFVSPDPSLHQAAAAALDALHADPAVLLPWLQQHFAISEPDIRKRVSGILFSLMHHPDCDRQMRFFGDLDQPPWRCLTVEQLSNTPPPLDKPSSDRSIWQSGPMQGIE